LISAVVMMFLNFSDSAVRKLLNSSGFMGDG
jgi:hypothetical protein